MFADPPDSTEQMLHPASALLGGARDTPTAIVLPDLAALLATGYRRVYEGNLGEAGLLLLLDEQLPLEARGIGSGAARGWDGDRYSVYVAAASQRPVLAWLLVWDSVDDADEFVAAYRVAAERRNESRAWPAAVVERGADRAAVAVVEGAPAGVAAKCADALLAAAPEPNGPGR